MALAYNLLNSAGIVLPEPKVTTRTSFTGTAAAETLYGTAGADYFATSGGGADVAVGSTGDDIYVIGGGDSLHDLRMDASVVVAGKTAGWFRVRHSLFDSFVNLNSLSCGPGRGWNHAALSRKSES